MPPAKPRQISRWPLLGFVSALPRQLIPFGAMGPGSKNWLVGNQRQLRVPGGDTVTNGLLESTWGAVAKRVYAAALRSVTNGFSVPLVLFMNEAAHYATLCFRSTNGGGSWRTVGQEFSTFHYPDDTAPNHRVMPMVYENQYGGLTVHRLNTAEHRARWANGSRSIHFSGGQAIIPSIPARWNTRFNDATDAGSEPCEVFPLGLVPPLAMPTLSIGANVSAGNGSWRGSQTFCYSVAFENDRGELSWMAIPRLPGSAWPGYEGFGYFQVDSGNPTNYYEYVYWSNIVDGPPGTRWKWLLRTTSVASNATTVLPPELRTMSLIARVPQGVHEYKDYGGNDTSLDPEPRIADMATLSAGLQFPPPAATVSRFDGHLLLGNLKPHRYAMFVMPWESGLVNGEIGDDALYSGAIYGVGVYVTDDGPDTYTLRQYLRLRKVVAGTPDDTDIELDGLSLRALADIVNRNASLTDATHTDCDYATGSDSINLNEPPTDVAVGDIVVSPDFHPWTTVTAVPYSLANPNYVRVSMPPTTGGTAQTVLFRHAEAADSFPWAAGVVPGADADEPASSLLATLVRPSTATVIVTEERVLVPFSISERITPGMLVGNDADDLFAAGTVVISVGGDTGLGTAYVATSNPALVTRADIDDLVFYYDTGDAGTTKDGGLIRTPGNCNPAPLFWSKSYLDRSEDRPNDVMFSAASPGYPQDGINTWMRANRPSGPDVFGHHMAFADMGALAMVWFAKARMRLWNQRTGSTHEDADYWLTTSSWSRGCRCPFAVVSGNGWALFLSDEGFFGVGVQTALSQYGDLTFASESPEKLISKALYDAERPEGERGELEHSILRCIASSDSGGSDYPITASVDGGVLYVNYERADGSRWQIRYDFSMGSGRTGLAEILQDDGEPYAWSAPLEFAVEACAKVPQSDGKVHLYAAIAGNTGETDGRVDELGSSDDYNGAPVVADDFSGLAFSGSLDLVQPTDIRATLMRRAATGVTVGIMQNPQLEPTDPGAIFVPFPVGNDNMDAFGRSVVQTDTEAARGVPAVAIHVRDDGSGPPSEITQLRISVTETASVTTERDP